MILSHQVTQISVSFTTNLSWNVDAHLNKVSLYMQATKIQIQRNFIYTQNPNLEKKKNKSEKITKMKLKGK